jgi:hypothetical protein
MLRMSIMFPRSWASLSTILCLLGALAIYLGTFESFSTPCYVSFALLDPPKISKLPLTHKTRWNSKVMSLLYSYFT